MTKVCIIGANRGIGLEFVKQYLEQGDEVCATYRQEDTLGPLRSLQETYEKKLSLHRLDVTDITEVQKLSQTIDKIDILVLNAGIKGCSVAHTKPPENTESELTKTLDVNTKAPDNIIRFFYPQLSQRENACIVYISTRVASISDNKSGGSHPYRISKAAGNAMVRNWDIQLIESWKEKQKLSERPCAFAICPGWVKTDMGGPLARLTAEKSVSCMKEVIAKVIQTKESHGLYMYDGSFVETYDQPDILK